MTTSISIAVVGAHLEGQPLHHQLTSRGAGFVQRTTTAPSYRMYALATEPPKPGPARVADGGGAVEVEVWALEPEGFATFVDGIPAPLTIGRLVLADGSDVAGFLCEPVATVGADDITAFGGWRGYLAR
jgi:allophanate hydrolase